jgi:hypothetical protein
MRRKNISSIISALAMSCHSVGLPAWRKPHSRQKGGGQVKTTSSMNFPWWTNYDGNLCCLRNLVWNVG